jgi:hypothetical protein
MSEIRIGEKFCTLGECREGIRYEWLSHFNSPVPFDKRLGSTFIVSLISANHAFYLCISPSARDAMKSSRLSGIKGIPELPFHKDGFSKVCSKLNNAVY